MKPIDHFDQMTSNYCPWLGRELTQTSVELEYICRRNYGAGARGSEPCGVADWLRCTLVADQMLPLKMKVAAAEKSVNPELKGA